MYEGDDATGRRLLVSLPKLLILGYCLHGAINGKIQFPGGPRASDLFFRDYAAWVVCLFPILWLVADAVWYGKLVGGTLESRRLISRCLVVSAFATLFIAQGI